MIDETAGELHAHGKRLFAGERIRIGEGLGRTLVSWPPSVYRAPVSTQDEADAAEEMGAIAMAWRSIVRRHPEAQASTLATLFGLIGEATQRLGGEDFVEFMRMNVELGQKEREDGRFEPSAELLATLRQYVEDHAER